ncbi:hypothetical protein ABT294_38830 [Nonomuraea sp. NPDC000554]|uniref:hypothetical protein n=1 Tax=Nonomuraea sp. NPDC000554 TaxID=3154259 RepID=UPI00331D82A4
MGHLRKAAEEFAFLMVLGLIGFGVIFGVSALLGLPWLVDVLGSGRVAVAVGALALLGLLGFGLWLQHKIRKVRGRSAE